MPCTQKRARLLLERGRARIHRLVPFVIRLIDRKAEDSTFQMVRVKLDPGSKTTGIAVVREIAESPDVAVLNLMELVHRVGTHCGRVAIRASGSFNIQTPQGAVQGVAHRFCKLVQRNDGYGYSLVAKTDATGMPSQQRNASRPALYLTGMNADVSRAN